MTRPHTETWCRFLTSCQSVAAAATPYQVSGRLTRINGLVLEATGLKLPLGSGCRIVVPMGSAVDAEVVGFSGDKLFMMPTDDIYGVAPGAQVLPLEALPQPPQAAARFGPRRRATDRAKHVPVGEELLGRVVDGSGRPLDGAGPINTTQSRSLHSRPINPLQRAPIDRTLDVGVRAINAMLTVP